VRAAICFFGCLFLLLLGIDSFGFIARYEWSLESRSQRIRIQINTQEIDKDDSKEIDSSSFRRYSEVGSG
jgi:hypothetical protein